MTFCMLNNTEKLRVCYTYNIKKHTKLSVLGHFSDFKEVKEINEGHSALISLFPFLLLSLFT